MCQLVLMKEIEFSAYAKQSIADFARQQGNLNLETAAKAFHLLLPQGVNTPHHYIYNLQDNTLGVTVGALWFGDEGEQNQKNAFLYDLIIHPPYQRMGYGSNALKLIERKVKALGLNTLELNVFANNQSAIALYNKAGFSVTQQTMIKIFN